MMNCILSIAVGGVIYIVAILILGVFSYEYVKGKINKKN